MLPSAPRHVACYDAFDRFHGYLGAAVAVWEGYGCEAVVDSPVVEEFRCLVGGELRASVGG